MAMSKGPKTLQPSVSPSRTSNVDWRGLLSAVRHPIGSVTFSGAGRRVGQMCEGGNSEGEPGNERNESSALLSHLYNP